jgi:Mg2+-importing ATPase
VGFIRDFMVTFGLISSVFDFLTFGVLLIVLNASVGAFRTGWFVESVVTELLTLLIIRTRRPFFRSNVGRYLLLATLVVAFVTVSVSYTPLGTLLSFVSLPAVYLLVLGFIVVFYATAMEIAKRVFYARTRF